MHLKAIAPQAEVQVDLLAWEQEDRIEEEERIHKQKREKTTFKIKKKPLRNVIKKGLRYCFSL